MTVKRLFLVLPALALLAACGEVLEGTISDAMLPVDSVRSEPPLEDPEAFAKARSKADGAAGADKAAAGEEADEGEQPAAEDSTTATPDAAPQAADE